MSKNKILLAALSLAGVSWAAAASAMTPAPQGPAPSRRARLAVGFASHPHLNAAIEAGLDRRGVQAVAAAALIPGRVYPLLVEGQLEDVRSGAGQVSCAARFSVGAGSGSAAADSYKVVASVALPAKAGATQAARVELAEESCIAALGAQIAASVAGAAAPTAQ